jgi:hypothetical protein
METRGRRRTRNEAELVQYIMLHNIYFEVHVATLWVKLRRPKALSSIEFGCCCRSRM